MIEWRSLLAVMKFGSLLQKRCQGGGGRGTVNLLTRGRSEVGGGRRVQKKGKKGWGKRTRGEPSGTWGEKPRGGGLGDFGQLGLIDRGRPDIQKL